jgi:hypothetical protein
VQEPHKGCFGRQSIRCVLGHSGVFSGEAERRPIDTLRRQRIRRAIARTREACERRFGEVRAKVFVAGPRGAKPMGGASDRRAKPSCGCKALPGGLSPVTDVRQAGLTPSGGGDTAGPTVGGFLSAETL